MKTTSRTISQIVRAHTLTYFNLLNVILAGFIILSGQYKNMLFMGIVISNSLIGIIQECKVKSLIDKLSVITATKARKLAADGTITEIPIESLAVSDTILTNNSCKRSDRKSTRLNSSHKVQSRMPSSA